MKNPFKRAKPALPAPPQQDFYRWAFNPFTPVRYEPNSPEVNDQTVLGIPAAWRAVDLLTSTVGNMPLHAYKGDQRLGVTPIILEQPNTLETRQETISSIIYSLIMRGNAYLYLGGWDEMMMPTMFEVINPDAVSIETVGGEPFYKIGSSEPLTRYEIIHIRYLKTPGNLYGVGPVEACRLGLENTIALENYGRRSWIDNGVPSVAITVDNPALTPDQAEEIKARWMANHSGSVRVPSVLGAGMSVEPLSFSPQDAEFLATKVHGIVEIANIFGIPPTRLGAPGATTTYFNAQQDDLHFMKYTIQNWMIRLESALTKMLPANQEAKFNPDHLLRGSTTERYAAHKVALDAGFMTINEIRALENLKPLDGGDELPHKDTTPDAQDPPSTDTNTEDTNQ